MSKCQSNFIDCLTGILHPYLKGADDYSIELRPYWVGGYGGTQWCEPSNGHFSLICCGAGRITLLVDEHSK